MKIKDKDKIGISLRAFAEHMSRAGFGGVALYRNAIVQYARTEGYSENDVENYFFTASRAALLNFLKEGVGVEDYILPEWFRKFALEGSNPSKTLGAKTRRQIERAKLSEFAALQIPDIDWKFEKKKLLSVMDAAAFRYGFSKIKNKYEFQGSGFSKTAYQKYYEKSRSYITIGYDVGARNDLAMLPCLSLIHIERDEVPIYLGGMEIIIPELSTYSVFYYIQESDDDIIRFGSDIKSATLGVFAIFEANEFFGNNFLT